MDNHEKGFIKWNGVYLPFPKYLTEVKREQLVDAGRNAAGQFVGARINRRQIKIELTWKHLSAIEWSNILKFMEDFVGNATFYDPLYNKVVTRKMYWGNATETIFKLAPNKENVAEYIDCTCNLIDCGGEVT